MKRSYESGSQKKKKKDQRQDFISKLPKLSSFFTATAVAAGPSADEEQPSTSFAVTGNVTAPLIPSGSGSASSNANDDLCQQTDGDQVIQKDENNDNIDCETHILVDDPALWPKLLTDRERCSLVQLGPVQVKDKDFPQNEKGRRFTKAYYCIEMKNGERVNRSWLVYSVSVSLLKRGYFCILFSFFHAFLNLSFRKTFTTPHILPHPWSKCII